VDGWLVDLGPDMATTVAIKTGSRRLIEDLMLPMLRHPQESLREQWRERDIVIA
jgi:hemolysin D